MVVPQAENVYFEGLEEPYLKRTVEGDLGMRSSASKLAKVHCRRFQSNQGIVFLEIYDSSSCLLL